MCDLRPLCSQLGDLNDILTESSRHFVRCFKPNDTKKPDMWDVSTVSRQLHTSGVLDALRVARTGFPDRMPFLEFVTTFSLIAGGEDSADKSGEPKTRCSSLLPKLGIDMARVRLGNERVFLGAGMLEGLKTIRMESMGGVAGKIQAAARGMAARLRARTIRITRKEKLVEVIRAAQGDDMATLKLAVDSAISVGVQFSPGGADALKTARAKLAALEKDAAERKEATSALEAAMDAHDAQTLRTALQVAFSPHLGEVARAFWRG